MFVHIAKSCVALWPGFYF